MSPRVMVIIILFHFILSTKDQLRQTLQRRYKRGYFRCNTKIRRYYSLDQSSIGQSRIPPWPEYIGKWALDHEFSRRDREFWPARVRGKNSPAVTFGATRGRIKAWSPVLTLSHVPDAATSTWTVPDQGFQRRSGPVCFTPTVLAEDAPYPLSPSSLRMQMVKSPLFGVGGWEKSACNCRMTGSSVIKYYYCHLHKAPLTVHAY